MDRPRVVSVVSQSVEERLPPDEAGVRVLESYVPDAGKAASQAAGVKPLALQPAPAPAAVKSPEQKPGNGGLLGSLFSRISSLFRR
ncbi:MAG: hypothetical protein WCX64_00890 [Candidatus Micrarchaeia archaeon]